MSGKNPPSALHRAIRPCHPLVILYQSMCVCACVCVCMFFTLTDRVSTIPSSTRGCHSGTWSAGQGKCQRNTYKAATRASNYTLDSSPILHETLTIVTPTLRVGSKMSSCDLDIYSIFKSAFKKPSRTRSPGDLLQFTSNFYLWRGGGGAKLKPTRCC